MDVAHPRDRTGPELNALRKELLAFLAEERQRARAGGGGRAPPAGNRMRAAGIYSAGEVSGS